MARGIRPFAQRSLFRILSTANDAPMALMDPVRPVMVAVGGDSGTGKTTISRGLYDIFGAENIVNICLDDYHTLDRLERATVGITALDPRANDIALMERHVEALRRGETIEKPVYDHSTGTFAQPERVEPAAIVIIRGLFPLFSERLRAAFDVRLWLDPDPELRVQWKVKRDVAQRGYTVAQVRGQIAERQDDADRYVLPQRAHADLIVRFQRPAGPPADGDGHLDVRLWQRGHLPKLDLDDILDAAKADDPPALRLGRGDVDGERRDVLEIDGAISPERAAEMEERIWAHMRSHRHLRPDEIGTFLYGTEARHSDPLALTQILLAYLVVRCRERASAQAGGVAIRRSA